MKAVIITIEVAIILAPLLIHIATLKNLLSSKASTLILQISFALLLCAMFINTLNALLLINLKPLTPTLFFNHKSWSLFLIPTTFICYLIKFGEMYERG